MGATAEHRQTVIAEILEGGEVRYDDGDVAVIGRREPNHVAYLVSVGLLLLLLANAVIGVVLAEAYGRPGGTGQLLEPLLLLLAMGVAAAVLIVSLAWRSATATAREVGTRVVHSDGSGRVHVVPIDVYRTRTDH